MRVAVNEDERHVRILVLRDVNRLLKQEARRHDDLRTVLHSLVDGFQVRGGALFRGLIILVGDAFFLGILHQALPGALIERFVVDGTNVGDEGKFRLFAAGGTAGEHGKRQHDSQCKCKQFFHVNSPFRSSVPDGADR